MGRLFTLFALTTLALATPGFAQFRPASAPTANRTRFPNFLGTTGLLYTPSAYTL